MQLRSHALTARRHLVVSCLAAPASRISLVFSMVKRSAAPNSPANISGNKRPRLSPIQAIPAHKGQQANGSKKTAASSASSAPIDKNAIWMIVGLGNPGAQYERTRHNVGFLVIDELARSHDIDCRKLEKSAAVGKGKIEGQQVLLVKPVTFMNNSGEAVSQLAKFYKVPSQRILVISDDLDIPHAALRMRARGGHGGHNGLRSIMERMGNTQEFPRIKVGIGRPAGDLPIATWVLQDFTRKEMESMEVSIQESCDLVRKAMAEGLDKALSTVKGAEPPAKQPKQPATPKSTAASPAAAAAQQPKAQPSKGPVAGAGSQEQQEQTQQQAVLTAKVEVEPEVVTVAAGR